MLRRVLLLFCLALSLVGVAWLRETRLPVRPAGSPPVTVVIKPGMRVVEIAGELHAAGLVRHPWIFRLLAVQRGVASRLRAGEYRFSSGQSPSEILDRLVRGDVLRYDVTFPEGKSIDEMARIGEQAVGIPAADFLRAAHDPSAIRDLDPEAPDLEGYLFPDTYSVVHGHASGAALVERMVARFREVAVPLLPEARAHGHSLREVVTLASLVELETARDDERPRIAAVFLNRLKKGMLLQTDPTVIYALRKLGRYDGNIRKDDLEVDSRYNTYRVPGLPPGPIASPGRAAIEAVLHPAPVKDLYFVSRNDGTHHFSATLREHERAVDRYQRRRTRPSRSGG